MNRFLVNILILTLMSLSLPSSAQKLTVDGMKATNDLSASQHRRKDLSGEACALVKVQLATADVGFEGNVIRPVEYKGGEYWVYMSKGSRELRIKHMAKSPSFVPCHVSFSDYGIRNLESLTTYNLTLLLPQGVATEQTQKLTINYSPADAMVLVDSKPYKGNGRVEFVLPLGNHNYIIAAEGYESAEGSVKLTAASPRTITEELSMSKQHDTVTQANIQQPIDNVQSTTDESSISMDTNWNVLGADFRPITTQQKEELGISFGMQIQNINKGSIKAAGITKGFIIQHINNEPIISLEKLRNVVMTNTKKTLEISGLSPTGKKYCYTVKLSASSPKSITEKQNNTQQQTTNQDVLEDFVSKMCGMYNIELSKTSMSEIETLYGIKQKKGTEHYEICIKDDTVFRDIMDNGICSLIIINPQKTNKIFPSIDNMSWRSSYKEWNQWFASNGFEEQPYEPYYQKQAMLVYRKGALNVILMFSGKETSHGTWFALIISYEPEK